MEDVACLAPHVVELTVSAAPLLHSAPQLVGHPGCSRDDEVVEADVTVDPLGVRIRWCLRYSMLRITEGKLKYSLSNPLIEQVKQMQDYSKMY